MTKAPWRPLGLALLLLCGAAWSDNRGSGGSSNSGSGSNGMGGGMARPMGVPTQLPSQPSTQTSSQGPGAGTANRPTGSSSGRDTPRADDLPRDGQPAARAAREDGMRGNGSPPRPDTDAPDSRWQRGERLVRSQPLTYERDPFGAPVLRAEITLLLPPDADLPAGLARRGFIAVRESVVLGRRLVVLRTPADLPLSRAVDVGRQLAPEAEIDFNHVLLGSGRAEPAPAPKATATTPAAASAAGAEAAHVGLIDEALPPDAEAALTGELRPVGRRCLPTAAPTGHGLAVATVLARAVREAGRRPVLHAADIGCGQGGVDAIAAALQTMDAERVPVVNVSAVGPHNRVMAAVVAAFLARGHLLVAAVGNEGPAAPPLYPAAYPGVIGVTAVDRQGRVLVEAGRGDHVAFAAPGLVELPAPGGGLRSWRGTSLAAPVVAGALAVRLAAPDAAAAQAAVGQLARSALPAGEPGWDRVYGHGIVGLALPALAVSH